MEIENHAKEQSIVIGTAVRKSKTLQLQFVARWPSVIISNSSFVTVESWFQLCASSLSTSDPIWCGHCGHGRSKFDFPLGICSSQPVWM